MTLGLVVVLAVMTYASRAAAMVLLPPPGPRLAALLDRMPAPLFAGLAAVALISDGPTVAPVTTIAALGGALLVACAQLVVSGTSTPASDVSARPRTPRQLITAPTEALKDVTPRTVAAVMPILQSIPIPGLRSPVSTASAAKIVAPASSRIVSPPEPNVPIAAALDSTPVSSSTSVIEAAPEAGSITPGVPVENEPVILPVDSSGKQAMKRILRTIGGSPVSEAKSSKQ